MASGPAARSGPLIIGFDGTPAARNALREAAALFPGHRALVVVVWEPGRTFDAVDLPVKGAEAPLSAVDLGGPAALDRALGEGAGDLARTGAALADRAGLRARGLAMAAQAGVADTLVRLARDRAAPAVVLGTRGRHTLGRLLLGSTSQAVIAGAPCPVVVVGAGTHPDGSS